MRPYRADADSFAGAVRTAVPKGRTLRGWPPWGRLSVGQGPEDVEVGSSEHLA